MSGGFILIFLIKKTHPWITEEGLGSIYGKDYSAWCICGRIRCNCKKDLDHFGNIKKNRF